MAEKYEPIDMKDYPYKSGDKLPCGITVLSIIKGDVNDSFGGHLCKKVMKVEDGQKVYSEKTFTVPHLSFTRTKPTGGGKTLELVATLPNPYAQRVYYQLPNGNMEFCRPDEFLKIAKGKAVAETPPKVEEVEESEVVSDSVLHCKATTKSGNPCKGKVVPGGTLCMSHGKQ